MAVLVNSTGILCSLRVPCRSAAQCALDSLVDFGAVYIVCLFFPTYPFFFTFFLTYLFPYFSFPLRIDPEEYLIRRLNEWKNNVENRGMRVNMNKTKVMISGERQKTVQKAARWPCGVCGRGVGSNSIQCTSCRKWVHKKCSGIKGSMYKLMRSFICRGCSNPIISTGHTSVDIGASANQSINQILFILQLDKMTMTYK